jgi:hopanoid biosynthesis associated RND transporter like protein HpnN
MSAFSAGKDRSRSEVGRLIAAATAAPWVVATAGLMLALISIGIAAAHFSINSDPDALLSPNLPYRKAEIAFSKLFPQSNANVVVVIDGATPELAEEAAAGLSAKLASNPAMFKSVQRPDGGPFWSQEGLLFATTADVKSSVDQLIAAEPFIGPMAGDPSLRGLMESLGTALKGVSAGQTSLDKLDAPIRSLGDALEAQQAGRHVTFSWQTMIGGGKAAEPRRLRKLILVEPRLNFSDLRSGSQAIKTIREDARNLGFDEAHGVRVRLTGPVPLRDEELGSLGDRALPIGMVAVSAIVLMLWLATRSPKVIIAILVTTMIGLASAAALGLLIFHAFNVISIAFIPLFVGLGIDFGIQLSVRYRYEHLPGSDRRTALIRAGEAMGRPLTLAAAAIAAGFLAFAPTAYRGVSQLGVIAGLGMLIALALNLTVLPALIQILKPRPAPRRPPSRGINQIDKIILGHRWWVVGAAVAAALASAAMLPLLTFDFNPLHLRSSKTESVSTLLDLFHDPDFPTHTLEVVRPTLAEAEALAARAKHLPEVKGARTLADFVPTDQGPKLAAITDASTLLDLTINPIVTAPAPADAEVKTSLAAMASDLRAVAEDAGPTAGANARRLASALEKLAAGSPAMRAEASALVITPLGVMLDQIRGALAAQPVTLASLPPDITRAWRTTDGRYRVSISPRGDANQDAVLVRFIEAVRKIAPDAAGDPVDILEGGRTVVGAFIEAGVLSFIAITGLLFLVLRRVRDVAITMAPIVLTGLLTMGSCVVIGQPLNFANIIALPLLFGIGVAFHIYFVMSWRSGGAHLLTSSLARAVFFSALTTATGFGSLWLSSHPGTASMGKLLMISLIWTLVSALLFQPALMGAPPKMRAPA